MKLKKYLFGFFASLLILSVMSAAVPLHNILHEHYFVKADACGHGCEKHLKNYSKPCCSTSDAIFISDLPQVSQYVIVNRSISNLYTYFKDDNYFQFYHLTKNKAPPVIA